MLAALFALALAAPARAAVAPGRLKLVASSVESFATDGSRWAAWETTRGGPLTVLDTRSGGRQVDTLPSGCQMEQGFGYEFGDTGAAGRFLLSCEAAGGEQDMLLDAATGTTRTLRAGYSFSRLGSLYAEGEDARETSIVSSLSSGTVRGAKDEYVDLNSPGAPGLASVCRTLRQRLRHLGSPIYGRFTYLDGVLVEPFGSRGRVAQRRCDGTRTLLHASLTPAARPLGRAWYLDPRGGLLTWDTAEPDASDLGEEGQGRSVGRLEAVLTGGRRREWRLPRLPIPTPEGTLAHPRYATAGFSTHTRAMVFWLPVRTLSCDELCDTATEDVYGAPVR
jgi:hypothetical protein